MLPRFSNVFHGISDSIAHSTFTGVTGKTAVLSAPATQCLETPAVARTSTWRCLTFVIVSTCLAVCTDKANPAIQSFCVGVWRNARYTQNMPTILPHLCFPLFCRSCHHHSINVSDISSISQAFTLLSQI